jgi:proline iminopeptidase
MKIAQINDIQMAYTDTGSGTPLICLHGGMGIDSFTLRVPGILDLENRGIRLIIPDQRGHGLSTHSISIDYTHKTWAADIHALTRYLGLSRFALLGHSYGGFLALEYAVRWPQTFTHLVLVSTSAGPVHASQQTYNSDDDLREHFEEVWPNFFSGPDKHWEVFEQAQFSADTYNAAFTRELPKYNLRYKVVELDIPMLLIVGRDDWYLEPMRWLAENCQDTTLRIFEEVGHFPFIEAAVEFRSTIAKFLNR